MSGNQIALGDIVATHGVAGWVRVKLFNPEGRTLYSAEEVELARGENRRILPVDRARPHRGLALLKLRGVDDMDAARDLVGCRLSVQRDALAPLSASEYYHEEVVGFEVVDAAGARIGTVTRIWPRPGGDLLVVAAPGKEHLIPAVREFIRHVDIVNGTVTIDLPEGLLEIE